MSGVRSQGLATRTKQKKGQQPRVSYGQWQLESTGHGIVQFGVGMCWAQGLRLVGQGQMLSRPAGAIIKTLVDEGAVPARNGRGRL